MKLTKAIELNDDSEKSLRDHKFIDYADAVRLGNEALKRIQRNREGSYDPSSRLLPGEDEE